MKIKEFYFMSDNIELNLKRILNNKSKDSQKSRDMVRYYKAIMKDFIDTQDLNDFEKSILQIGNDAISHKLSSQLTPEQMYNIMMSILLFVHKNILNESFGTINIVNDKE